MAVSLKARISLVDKFSAPMRQIERQVERNQRALDKLRSKSNQSGAAMSRMGTSVGRASKSINMLGGFLGKVTGGVGRLASSINPLNNGLLNIAAAASAAYGAVKIFNATVGEAMKMQQSKVMITSMFNDKKISKEYMAMMDKIAIKSPILDSQQMYGNSKSFITASKDIKQLEKMWSLAERLSASDPMQGLEGAVFALRELFSGDAISLQRRFEMDGNVLADIKALPLEQQLKSMDKYFNKIGLTTKLIDDMGGTALGMWMQVKERFQLVLRDMGEPSLKAVSKFLLGLMSRLEGQPMKDFAEWGGRVINNMVGGLTTNAIKLYDWFVALSNDPEFKSKSTLFGKVDFIVEDIVEKLRAWYDGGGREGIVKFGSEVTETLMGILNNSAGFLDVGITLGNSLVQGIVQGIESSAKSSAFGKVILAASKASPFGAWGTAQEAWKKIRPGQQLEPTGARANQGGSAIKKRYGGNNSHSAGLDRVPYNGYQPTLHKDEKVLNAQEAREYREGGKGGNVYNFNVSMDGNGSMKSKARELMDEMARLIEQEGGQMA